MEWITHVYDCTGNLIFIDQIIVDANKKPIELYLDQYLHIVEAVSAPTLIFELNKKCPTRYYYCAAKHLTKPVLIGANIKNGTWKVKEYMEDPSASLLLTLLKQHLLDGGITIYMENGIEDKSLGNLFI
ncbi:MULTISPECIES: hypothetical protein [Niastella]|uniref:Uncharacterized protein n=1 Tax=Niastella soli TaxID=2821487 RepID=A0ABS3Z5S4_9BACT|nr:hypothetical protein [Niastella soli]MBO9205521.1 hypothetical protein [Niastella soli]